MLEKSRSGLDAVIHQGAQRRRHIYLELIRAAAPAAASAAVIAVLIYVLVLLGAGRTDWRNIGVIAAGVAAIPLIATSLLIVGARRDKPVTVALAVTVFAASLAIALLSASRVPISFTAILVTLPTTLFGVTLANIALARFMKQSAAMLAFPGAAAVLQEAGLDMKILDAEEVDSNVSRLLIDPVAHHTRDFAPTLARFYLRGISIETWPAFLEGYSGRVDIDSFDLGDVSYSSSQILYYRAKRIIDILAVMVLAAPALVLGAAVWLYIVAIDGGPALFIQQRRGYAGSVFRLFKFRTMYRGDHSGSTTANDDRILPGCRLVRQFRLDELPQLLNIFRGDMSFIGPRPVSVEVAEMLEATLPQYVNRQILVPGLTGWAQVSQGYAATREEEVVKLAFDLYYLKHVSLDLDIIIAFRTLRTVLLRTGAR